MKTIVIAASLAVGLLGAGALGVGFGFGGKGPEAASRWSDLSGSIEQLSTRVEHFEARMEALERGVRSLERSRANGVDSAAVTAPAAAETAEGGGPSLASFSEEQSRDLRELIADVVQKERTERKAREREQALAAQREMEEMSKGPYGEHNFRVNSLGKKLGFSDYQKQRYYEMLAAHRQRMRDLRKGLNLTDAEAAKAYRDRRREADEDFENTVVTVLTSEQAEAYRALDPGERGEGPQAVFFSSTSGPDGAGGEVKMDVMSRFVDTEAALPLAVQGAAEGALEGVIDAEGGLRMPLGIPVEGGAAGVTVRRTEVAPGGDARVEVKTEGKQGSKPAK